METIILVVHVLAAVALIGLIMIQQGKGAEAGASFGAGASQTLFGSSGSGNFLTRTSAILATVFFLTSFALAVIARDKADSMVRDDLGLPVAEEVQALEAAAEAEEELAPLDALPELPDAIDEGEPLLPDLK